MFTWWICAQVAPTLTSHWAGLPVTAALAAVALLGYMFGTRSRSKAVAAVDDRRQHELERAARIAWQLESIATALRHDLVSHHSQVAAFKRKLNDAQQSGDDATWDRLCHEAEEMLGPTMQLAHQLSHAYDQIRQQSDALQTFTQGRTDPLTGAGNGRALEQMLRVLLNSAARGHTEFAVAIVSLDRDPAAAPGRPRASAMPLLPKLAGIIRACMRDTDFVARYGDEEFVVVLPQTTLPGASVFGKRLMNRVADGLSTTVCLGIAEVTGRDDARALLARADSALYSAKAAGPNRLFLHTGANIREHTATAPPPQNGAATPEPKKSEPPRAIVPNTNGDVVPAEVVATGATAGCS